MSYSRLLRCIGASFLGAFFLVPLALADTPGVGFDPAVDSCGYLMGNAPVSNFGQILVDGAGVNQACVDQSGYFYSDADQSSKVGYRNTSADKGGVYPIDLSWSSTSALRPRVNFAEGGVWQGYAKIEGVPAAAVAAQASAEWLWFDWEYEGAENSHVRTDLATGITEGFAWNDYFGWIYFYQTLEIAELPLEVSFAITTEAPGAFQRPDEVTFQTAPQADGVDDWIVQVQFWDPLRQGYLGPEDIEALDIEYALTEDSVVWLDQSGFTEYAQAGENESALLFGGDSPAREALCESSSILEQETGEGHGFCAVLLDSEPLFASFIRSGAPTSNTVGLYGETLNDTPDFTDRLGCVSFYLDGGESDECESVEKGEVFFDRVDDKNRLELENVFVDFKPLAAGDRSFVLSEDALSEGQALSVELQADGNYRLQITPASGDKVLSFRPRIKVRDYYLVVGEERVTTIPREAEEVAFASDVQLAEEKSFTSTFIESMRQGVLALSQGVQLATEMAQQTVLIGCSAAGLEEDQIMLEVSLHDDYNDRNYQFSLDEYIVAPEEGFLAISEARSPSSQICITVAGPDAYIVGDIVYDPGNFDVEWAEPDEVDDIDLGEDGGSDARGAYFPGYYTLNSLGHIHNYFRFDERVELTVNDQESVVEVDIELEPRLMFDVSLADTGAAFTSPISLFVEGDEYTCRYISDSREHYCDFPETVLGGENFTVEVDGLAPFSGTLPAFDWLTQVVPVQLAGIEPPYPAPGDIIGDMVLDVKVTAPSDNIKELYDFETLAEPNLNYEVVYILETDSDTPVVTTGNEGGTFFRVDSDGSGGIDPTIDLGTVQENAVIDRIKRYLRAGEDFVQSFPVGYGQGLCTIGGVDQECPSYEDVVFPSAEVMICDQITKHIFGKESCYIGGYLPRYSFFTEPYKMALKGTTISLNEEAFSERSDSDFSAVGISDSSELRDEIFERVIRLTTGEAPGGGTVGAEGPDARSTISILMNGKLLFAKQDVYIQETIGFEDRTVVCLGCNIYVGGDIYDGRMGLISFKQGEAGGNIYIHPDVKELHVNIFADGSIFSDPRDFGGDIGDDGVPTWPDDATRLSALANQLYILGSVIAKNTVDATLDSDPTASPWRIGGGEMSNDYKVAQEYDWVKFRQFRLCYGVDPLTGEIDFDSIDLCSDGAAQLAPYDPDGSGPRTYEEASVIIEHRSPSEDQVAF